GVGLALLLTHWAGFAPLTAYLATSPGGADSVAIIAATSAVDAGFVMAMQIARFVMVLLFGPAVSRLIASRFAASAKAHRLVAKPTGSSTGATGSRPGP
ncbi:MAG: AbrB family transcriptional regulator, partial [Rhodoferax sp.]